MQAVAELKELLYGIMTTACQAGEVQANQQMGLSLTNAFKRDNGGGIVVIQNQSLQLGVIAPKIIEALRKCDAIEAGIEGRVVIEAEPLKALPAAECPQLPAPDCPNSDPVEACCEFMREKGTNWEDMQDEMKIRYIQCVVGHFKNNKNAADFLGVGQTYLCKLKKMNPPALKRS